MKTERTYLKNKLKTLETSTNTIDNLEYTKTNEKLHKIYQEEANGIRIRSKCELYEQGEIIFIFNLRKSRAVQNQIWNILIVNIEVNNQKDINNELYLNFKNSLMRDNTYQNLTETII